MVNKIEASVLVVDDEQHIRTLLSSIIRQIGYNLIGEAANGIEAIDLARAKQPDLILLDINMPQKSGTESLPTLIEIVPDCCIIMLTSIADMETVAKCINEGATNYIRKDTPLGEMKQLITTTWESFQRDLEGD
jgi:two-component system chemotaxis response regulator CheY